VCSVDSSLERHDAALDRLIDACPNLHTLKKRCAYLVAFTEYVAAKVSGVAFRRPDLDASYLDEASMKMIKYVLSRRFGAAIELSQDSPDEFDSILKRLGTKVNDMTLKLSAV